MLQTFYLSIIHQNHKYPLSQYGRAFFSLSQNFYISTEAGTEVCISWEYLTEMWFASVDLLWQAVGYKIDWLEGHHGPSGAITKVKTRVCGYHQLYGFGMGCHNINTAMFYMSGFQILCTVHFCNFFALTHLTPDNYSRSWGQNYSACYSSKQALQGS